MLGDLQTLLGSPVHAREGETGRVRDFLFDDRSWQVCYVVLDVGNWLKRRDVVLPVTAFEPPDWAAKSFRVRLTKEQVRQSPDVDSERPVSRQQDLAMRDYFGALACWFDAEFGLTCMPAGVRYPVPEGEDPHLRSAQRLIGYEVCATDGDFGRLNGFIMNEAGWRVGYLEVIALSKLQHRVVAVPTAWVRSVSWAECRVYLNRTRSGCYSQTGLASANAPADCGKAVHVRG